VPCPPRRFARPMARPRRGGAPAASLLAHAAPSLGPPLRSGSEVSAVAAMRPSPPIDMDPRGFGARPGRVGFEAPDPGRSRHLSYVLVAQDYDATARDRRAQLPSIASKTTNDPDHDQRRIKPRLHSSNTDPVYKLRAAQCRIVPIE
jgi:hypothetical protein